MRNAVITYREYNTGRCRNKVYWEDDFECLQDYEDQIKWDCERLSDDFGATIIEIEEKEY